MRLLVAIAFGMMCSLCWAQNDKSLFEILREAGLSDATGLEDASDVKNALKETLDNPETQSSLLNKYFTADPSWQFLKDIQFKFKAFDVDGSDDSALGYSYAYDKTIADKELNCRAAGCARGLDFSLSATGNVAFDSDTNPNDFLKSTASFGFFQSRGAAPQYRDQAHEDEVFANLIALEDEFVEAESEEEEEVIQEIVGLVRPILSDQFYFEIAGDASLESNQRFTEKQWAYGVHGVLEVKSWQIDSGLSRLNFFDYPFAAIRALSNYEDCGACFRPRGTSWPSLLVGLDRVSPQDMDPRALAGDKSDFDRLRVEASFRTPIARIQNNRIYAALNYRYYEELSASTTTEAADLDSFDYFTLTIGGSEGIYVSFTNGKLPLDATDDKVYELGFQFQLGN